MIIYRQQVLGIASTKLGDFIKRYVAYRWSGSWIVQDVFFYIYWRLLIFLYTWFISAVCLLHDVFIVHGPPPRLTAMRIRMLPWRLWGKSAWWFIREGSCQIYTYIDDTLVNVVILLVICMYDVPIYLPDDTLFHNVPYFACSYIDPWAVACFESNAHVHCWIVGQVVSKYWKFITDETASCFVCRYEWYFVSKCYEIFFFCRSCCWWVVFNCHHSLLWDFCARQCLGSSLPSMQQSGPMRALTTHRSMITGPVFGRPLPKMQRTGLMRAIAFKSFVCTIGLLCNIACYYVIRILLRTGKLYTYMESWEHLLED